MKAAIFDLDGTLIDSMGFWDKVGLDYLSKRGISDPGDIGQEVKSMSFAESAAHYIRKFGLTETCADIIAEWNTMACKAYADDIPIKEGVRDYLQILQDAGVKMAVATATERSLTESILCRLGIESFFEFVLTLYEVGKGKDDPKIFLLAAEKLGVTPEECTVFEDSLHAVLGAKAAGMKVCAVYDLYSAHEKDELQQVADGYIDSFEELVRGFGE